MGFLLENRHLFVTNNAVHDHDTLFIKEHFYNPKHFKKLLRNYLMEWSFYSLDEFYQASMLRLNL